MRFRSAPWLSDDHELWTCDPTANTFALVGPLGGLGVGLQEHGQLDPAEEAAVLLLVAGQGGARRNSGLSM